MKVMMVGCCIVSAGLISHPYSFSADIDIIKVIIVSCCTVSACSMQHSYSFGASINASHMTM